MRYYARRAWGILAVVGFVVMLAAWPGVATAAITNTKATLEGVTSTSAPPGSVMNANVTADVASATWGATDVQFGSARPECVDHDNRGSGNGQSITFKVTAPRTPGAYAVTFTPREGACKGTAGSPDTLTNGLSVTPPAPNDDLPPRCGINVMLVLDESGSIASSGQTETVKDATRAFLNELSGTGSKVSIVDFSSTAKQQVGYTTVTQASISSDFEPYLTTGYKPGGLTNWEAAFDEVKRANGDSQQPNADMVVFITDGDPTTHGSGQTNVGEGNVKAMRPALVQADFVKGQHSHVFAMGVGAAVTDDASATRLTAVSGPDEFPETDFAQADFTLVQHFADLAKALREIVTQLCQASVTITKLVDQGDGEYVADTGWKFSATVSVSSGEFKWLQPASASGASASQDTDDEGLATFQWKPSDPGATSTITLDEAVKPGYEFVNVVCTSNAGKKKRRHRVRRRSEPVKGSLILKPGEYYACTVKNKIKPGTIEIEKEARPEGPTDFEFTGTPSPLKAFTLVDDGKDESKASRIFSGLTPGTYTVSELVPDNWQLTGVTCTTEAATTEINGPEVAITLQAGGSAVCTYSDLRIEPPVPPEPPGPTPPGPTPPSPPAPPTPPPGTELQVVKTAPRIARVGQRIRFRLTVTNTGSVAARNVRMADVPPAALALVSLTSSTKARVVRRSAIWGLGTLDPGESRTVRGSVRIKAGTPGKKRNLVLATAVNARVASDRADTRLLRHRQAPPVTG